MATKVRYTKLLVGANATGSLVAVPGASILIRQNGVTCPVYSDAAGTAMANPVPTGVAVGAPGVDTAGRLIVFLEPGTGYDVRSTVGAVVTTVVLDDIPLRSDEPTIATQAELDAATALLVPLTTYNRGGPAAPELLDVITGDPDIVQPRGLWVSRAQGVAYIACDQKVVAVDVSNPANMVKISVLTDAENLLGGREVVPAGTDLVVSADNTGSYGSLVIIDASNPRAMRRRSFVRTTALDSIHTIQKVGHLVFTANSIANSMTTWDISNRDLPPVLRETVTLPQPSRVEVRGNDVYCSLSGTGGTGGLAIMDRRTLSASPVLLQHADLAGARGIALDGQLVHLACTSMDRIATVDVSVSPPVIRGQLADAAGRLDGIRELNQIGDTIYGTTANANSLILINAAVLRGLTGVVDNAVAGAILGFGTHAALAGANGIAAVVPRHTDGVAFATGVDGGLSAWRVPYQQPGDQSPVLEHVRAESVDVGGGGADIAGPASADDVIAKKKLLHKGDTLALFGQPERGSFLIGSSPVSAGQSLLAIKSLLRDFGYQRMRGEKLTGLGATGSGLVTPYTTPMDLTSATTSLRVKMRHATWANPASIVHVLSRGDEVGQVIPYEVRINTTGALEFNATPTGTTTPVVQRYNGFSAARTPGETVDMGILVDNNAGARRTRFYQNTGTEAVPIWTLMETVSTGSTNSIHAPGSYDLRLGARRADMIGGWDGEIMRVEIRNGDLTTAPVVTFDPAVVPAGTVLPFVADGRTWTPKGSANIVATATEEPITEFQSDPNALVLTSADLAGYAPINNPTFTGTVTLPGPPSAGLHAATKAYVDANASTSPTIDRTHTDLEVVNTTTETAIYSVTIPANTLGTDKSIEMTVSGDTLNNSGANVSETIKVKFGGTTIYESGTPNLATSATRRGFILNLLLANRGAANSQLAFLRSAFGGTGTPVTGQASIANAGLLGVGESAAATVDTTVNQTLEITVTHPSAATTIAMRRRLATTRVW